VRFASARRELAASAGMAVELVRSATLYPGVPYAYASLVPSGGLIYTAGACPLDSSGAVVAPGDVREQARQAVANLAAALDAAGSTLANVLKTTVYVVPCAAAAPRAASAAGPSGPTFGEHDPPSTLTGVTVLGYPSQLVEIEAVAAA
jgi:enamine deaminase RidA (YjgF/YER057c/UK114 family)